MMLRITFYQFSIYLSQIVTLTNEKEGHLKQIQEYVLKESKVI